MVVNKFSGFLGNVAVWLHVEHRLTCLVNAYRRKHNFPTIDSSLEALIISPGGVASTMLINHIRKFKVVNSAGDSDGLKHLPLPPDHVLDIPVILISGDTDSIIDSLEHQGYLEANAVKLGTRSFFLVPRFLRRATMRRSIKSQEKNWITSSNSVLVVEYETLWKRKKDIALHLGIHNGDFVSLFPIQKNRESAI
jgi:hypothetical protein